MTPWRFLFISVFTHILLWFIFNHLREILPSAPQKTEAVEITVVDQSKKEDQKQLVRQALNKEEEKPKDAKYLSEKDQKVEKETKAAKSGLTQNRKPSPVKKLNLSKLTPELPKGPGPNKNQDRKGEPESTSGEHLPETATGPITALNTERFVYYTFFARIEEKLRPLWEKYVHETERGLSPQERKRLADKIWTSQVEVLLDSKGYYLETLFNKESGLPAFDHCVVEAFRDAALFPNPPKGMIGPDGKVRLKYSFILTPEY